MGKDERKSSKEERRKSEKKEAKKERKSERRRHSQLPDIAEARESNDSAKKERKSEKRRHSQLQDIAEARESDDSPAKDDKRRSSQTNGETFKGIRLNWQQDYFGGREAELKTLRNAIEVPKNGIARCRIFFIQGPPGIGKTHLVRHAFKGTKTVLAYAKFDDSQATTPLQAWVDATSYLLSEMEQDKEFRIHLYKTFQLSSETASDYLSIITSIPQVGERLREYFEVRPREYRGMVTNKRSIESFRSFEMPGSGRPGQQGLVPDALQTNIEPSSAEKDQSFERLKLAYRELYRVFCKYITVVMFMDDLQWGEPDDYRIMDTLLADEDLEERLIFVGAHRPVSMLHGLNLVKKPGKRYCRTITLGPLAPFEVSEMMCKLLKRDDDDIVELVTCLHRKTNGNPFFMVQFVQALVDKGYVYYSLEKSQWEWDAKKIEKKEKSFSDDAVEIVYKKLKKEPRLAHVLKLAAFIGSTLLHVSVLVWILEEEVDGVKSEEDLQNLMKMGVEMGLLERVSRREYQFAHDLIRDSALTLLPKGEELAKMHCKVGLRLRSKWEKHPKNDRLLFQTVTQLNSGKAFIKTPMERMRLANLNFTAAEAAMKRSAFYPAVHFLRRTNDLLAEHGNGADTHDFKMKTETALARMEFCCGLLDRSIERADTILKTASKDRIKAEAMHLKASCYLQQKKPKECLAITTEALSMFGVYYPKMFVRLNVLRLYSKARALLKNVSDQDVLNLPMANEERYQLASECLPWISEMALTYGYQDHLTCAMLTAIPLSIEKGRNSMTAQTLVSWGSILSEEGEIAEAYRFGQLGLQMAEKRIGGLLDDRVYSLYYQWIHHLRHPYADGVEQYSQALKTLWLRGSLDGVVMDTVGFLRHYYLAGFKLGPLLHDMRHFRDLCNDFGKEMAQSLVAPFAQLVLNLVEGPNEDMLRGEFMMQTESIKFWLISKAKVGIQLYYFYKMMASYFFNAYLLAGKFATKVRKMYLEGADNLVPYRFFFRALAAWTAYGINKRPKYRRLARQMTAQVEKFVQAGLVNCEHSLLFLKAERLAALSRGKDRSEVKAAYDAAIKAALKGGILYDLALANERAGQYFKKIEDRELASRYLQRSRDCYLDWEANAKAHQMKREYGDLLMEDARASMSVRSTRTSISIAEAFQTAQHSPSPSFTKRRVSSTTQNRILATVPSLEFDESDIDSQGS